MRKIQWSSAPSELDVIQKRNFINVQIDAIGVGLASAAAPFLPVFLTRLGASNQQVGMLISLPALAGLLFGLLMGRFLHNQTRIVPWFSAARLLVFSGYAISGLAGFIIPNEYLTNTILIIWAFISIPQTMVYITFTVVMNAVAGPSYRYELMSRRWSILGLTTAITVALVGLVLDQIVFPLNYQIVFIVLSIGGLISFYYSNHLVIPDTIPLAKPPERSLATKVKAYIDLLLKEKHFTSFVSKRFVYLSGVSMALPIFPLYYVRVVNANDAWIGAINTAQMAILLVGYFFWTRESRLRGSRFVLLWTTLGLSIYPLLTATTRSVHLIVVFAAISGIFQAGLDLVLFDELMKTIPERFEAIFVSAAQSFQHFSSFIAPIVGTLISNEIGLGGALLVCALIRLIGFGLFLRK